MKLISPLLFTFLRSREESNLQLPLRTGLFYPLNYWNSYSFIIPLAHKKRILNESPVYSSLNFQ